MLNAKITRKPFILMRAIYSIPLLISIQYSQELYMNSLITIDGIYIKNGDKVPANGTVYHFKKERKYRMGKLINGKKDGTWIEWHHKNRRLQETYKNGILDGSVSLFFQNGQKEWRHTYANGILDGNYTRWYENGHKAMDGFFENGVPVGIWVWKDKNGDIMKKEIYKSREKGLLKGLNQYVDKNRGD
tara:strand:+ start:874 stop:1437 length:564 start_codon:yes stop_codon:yes gene_type:complete